MAARSWAWLSPALVSLSPVAVAVCMAAFAQVLSSEARLAVRHAAAFVAVSGLVVGLVGWTGFDRLLAGRPRPEGQPDERGLLVASVGLAALVMGGTGLAGFQQDYVHFCVMWENTLAGRDPWVPPDYNVYGPLFNLLALVFALAPLAPKGLFAAAWVYYAVALARAVAWRYPGRPALPWLGLFAFLGNPFWCIDNIIFGHFDFLQVVPAVAAASWVAQGAWSRAGLVLALGGLLKYQPVALLPILVLGPLERGESPRPWDRAGVVDFAWCRRRVRLGGLVAFAATVAAGFGVSCLIWGWSPFTPWEFLGGRWPRLMSLSAFLLGPRSPLIALGLSSWMGARLVLPMTLAFEAFVVHRYVAGKSDPLVACAASALVSTLFYPVGYPQYETLPLSLMYLAWARGQLGVSSKVWVVFFSVFLGAFNLAYAWEGGWTIPGSSLTFVAEVIGLPAFLIRLALFVALMRERSRFEGDTVPSAGREWTAR